MTSQKLIASLSEHIIEPFNRCSNPVTGVATTTFQATTWTCFDKGEGPDKELIFAACGVDGKGRSAGLEVTGFNPFFYVLVDKMSSADVESLLTSIRKRLGHNSRGMCGQRETRRMRKLYPNILNREYTFLKLSFTTLTSFKAAVKAMKWQNGGFDVSGKKVVVEHFGTAADPINLFHHKLNIQPCAWIKVTGATDTDEFSTQLSLRTTTKGIKQIKALRADADRVIFSYDIECVSATKEFTDPTREGDAIRLIGITLRRYSSPAVQRIVITDTECDPVEGVTVIACKGEKGLLRAFVALFHIIDPDVVTGYNTWRFDDMYVHARMLMHGVDYTAMGRLNSRAPSLVSKRLSSGAYGDNTYDYIEMHGRVHFDMCTVIRKEKKFDSYTLGNVSSVILKKSKVDMKAKKMFEKFESGTPAEIAEIAFYCITDADLAMGLLFALKCLPGHIQMANIAWIPMDWLLTRGQQCRVYSRITGIAVKNKFAVHYYEKNPLETGGYKGGKVLRAKVGFYLNPVIVLDFASLYPSIMRAWNLCYSTLIRDQDLHLYDEAGAPYKSFTVHTDEDKKAYKARVAAMRKSGELKRGDPLPEPIQTVNVYHFAQCTYEEKDENGENIPVPGAEMGLLPQILAELTAGRKETRAMMKTESDPSTLEVLNCIQLAQKITSNSVYGFTGACDGILPCIPISSTVTSVGRGMIVETSEVMTDEFMADVIYGDSIPGKEKVTVRGLGVRGLGTKSRGERTDLPVEDLMASVPGECAEYRNFKIGDAEIRDKEYKDTTGTGLETLTHLGFQPVNKVIRHKASKKLYEVTAIDSRGVIHTATATSGHSFIGPCGEKVEAERLRVGDLLFDVSNMCLGVGVM